MRYALKVLFSFVFLALISDLPLSVNQQEQGNFLLASIGDNITLRCIFENNLGMGAKVYWYKQKLGMKPVLISSYLTYDQKVEFYSEFRSSNRFKLDFNNDNHDLHIMNVSMSDSSVYHCVRCVLHQNEFLESVTSLSPTAEVRQSPHEDTEPGHSVTLNCNVQTESCEGEHRVHWFKQSEESAAGLLYIKGSSSDQCESNTDSPTKSCVYKLPIHNVSSEQTGTYYCAVAACGQVLFGNGTRITIKCENNYHDHLVKLVYYESFFTLHVSFLFYVLTFYCFYVCTFFIAFLHLNSLHYAALSVHPSSRRQRVTAQTDCVYSSVHPHD
uniref:Ig-like domain-containing protein n=1 Tax=Periophthalmus magnuspinnatus TaxID=409849 RepID=A0A3B3ZWZ1_9GOBI